MKHSRKRFTMIAIALFCLLLCLALAMPAGAKTIKLKASTIFPLKHPVVRDVFDLWGNEIEKRTQGKVKFVWYHASTLVKAGQAYDALQAGLVDLALIPVAALPQHFPVSSGLGLPFMSESPFHSVEIGFGMTARIPEMKREWSKVKLLCFSSSDVNNLVFRDKTVRTLEDLKGMRIGTVWATVLKIVKALPCAAVQMTPEDIYMGMQRKMVDGAMVPNAALAPWRITEVTRSHTIGNFAVMPTAWAMSKRSYERLPADVKAVFDDLKPSFARLFGLTSKNTGAWILGALKKRGDVFITLTPEQIETWKKPMKPLYNAYIKSLEAKGMNGKKVFEQLQAISNETRGKAPSKVDDWWKKGQMGKLGKKK